MITNSFVMRRSLLVMSVGVVLLTFGDRGLSQDAEHKENELRHIQILLGAEKLDVVSPALKGAEPGQTITPMLPPGTESLSELHAPDHPGHPRAGLSFSGPPPAGPSGFGHPNFRPPGFGPPALRMEGRVEMHPGQGPQIQRPEAHSPEGLFAEDRKRIASLTESAERIAQAGLPDVAHGLRERAGQLERELAQKQERMQQERMQQERMQQERMQQERMQQERMQQEQRQKTESAMRERQAQARQQPQPHQPQRFMEQRREGIEIELGNHSTPPLRELHEQMEHLRRDMHKLSEQMTDLTRLIQQHHNSGNDRGHHDEDGDDEDGDDEDGDDEDGDDEDGDDEDGDDEDGDDEDGDDEDGDDEDGDDEDEMDGGDDDEMEEDDDEGHTERGEHE